MRRIARPSWSIGVDAAKSEQEVFSSRTRRSWAHRNQDRRQLNQEVSYVL